MDRSFLFVMGAQKAGTSWLYKVLNNLPETNFGIAKEYHVWDGIGIKECERFDLRPSPLILTYLKWRTRVPLSQLYIRKKMQIDNNYYFNYFEECLSGHSFTGDFTPSYAGLPLNNLVDIVNQFYSRNIYVKIIFLIRDPFTRALSAYKMHRRNRRFEEVDLNLSFESGFKQYFKSEACEIRTKYEKTLNNLQHLPSYVSIHIDSYENFLVNGQLAGLTDFIGLHLDKSNTQMFFNRAPVEQSNQISETLKASFYNHYKETYEYCKKYHPDLITSWTYELG